MLNTDQLHRFESIDEVYKTFTVYGCNDVELTYSGKFYYIANAYPGKKDNIDYNFTVGVKNINETNYLIHTYSTIEDMLDNYKENGIPLRDFILNMNVEYVYGVHPDDM